MIHIMFAEVHGSTIIRGINHNLVTILTKMELVESPSMIGIFFSLDGLAQFAWIHHLTSLLQNQSSLTW